MGTALGDAGLRVVRCAAPVGQPATSGALDAALAQAIRRMAAQRVPDQHLVLGGFSRGARVGASLVADLGAVGLLGLAYPFHGRHDPDPGTRVADLAALPTPALIVQGTRDALGNLQQVRGYALPEHIRFHWAEDANHALHPRSRSGFTQAQQLAEAAAVAVRFVRGLG
jgi:hypothetical protein